MKVSELGEFGLIELLANKIAKSTDKRLTAYQKLISDIGDDTAAWYGDRSTQLATVDCLIEGSHFTLETATWQELGWKSLAINISDIAAMGGLPEYALVSLALPGDTKADDVAALYDGLIEAAKQYEVAIIGGNTARAPQVSITITLTGYSHAPHLLQRGTAKPGDKIAVTGYLGSAAAGLQMLMKNLKFESEAIAYFRKAFLHPLPRIKEGQILVKSGVRTAIDISDGLISDMRHICQNSGVSARLEADSLPIHPLLKSNFGAEAVKLALGGGEDYELLFAASPETLQKANQEIPCPVTIIGEVTAGKRGEVTVCDKNGNPINTKETGWEHFKTPVG
jgi:thiamine-monophosphate kinase